MGNTNSHKEAKAEKLVTSRSSKCDRKFEEGQGTPTKPWRSSLEASLRYRGHARQPGNEFGRSVCSNPSNISNENRNNRNSIPQADIGEPLPNIRRMPSEVDLLSVTQKGASDATLSTSNNNSAAQSSEIGGVSEQSYSVSQVTNPPAKDDLTTFVDILIDEPLDNKQPVNVLNNCDVTSSDWATPYPDSASAAEVSDAPLVSSSPSTSQTALLQMRCETLWPGGQDGCEEIPACNSSMNSSNDGDLETTHPSKSVSEAPSNSFESASRADFITTEGRRQDFAQERLQANVQVCEQVPVAFSTEAPGFPTSEPKNYAIDMADDVDSHTKGQVQDNQDEIQIPLDESSKTDLVVISPSLESVFFGKDQSDSLETAQHLSLECDEADIVTKGCSNPNEVSEMLVPTKVVADAPRSSASTPISTGADKGGDAGLLTDSDVLENMTSDLGIEQAKVPQLISWEDCVTPLVMSSKSRDEHTLPENENQLSKDMWVDFTPPAHEAGQRPRQLSDEHASERLAAECATSSCLADDDSCSPEEVRQQEVEGDVCPSAKPDTAMGADFSSTLEADEDPHEDNMLLEKMKTQLDHQRGSMHRAEPARLTNELWHSTEGQPPGGDIGTSIYEADYEKQPTEDKSFIVTLDESSITREKNAIFTGINTGSGNHEFLFPFASGVRGEPSQDSEKKGSALDGQSEAERGSVAAKNCRTRERKNVSGTEKQQRGRKQETARNDPRTATEVKGSGKEHDQCGAKTTRKQKHSGSREQSGPSKAPAAHIVHEFEGGKPKPKNQKHKERKEQSGASRRPGDFQPLETSGVPGSRNCHKQDGAKPNNRQNNQEFSFKKKQKQKNTRETLGSEELKQSGLQSLPPVDSPGHYEPAESRGCKSDPLTAGANHVGHQGTTPKVRSNLQQSQSMEPGPSRWHRFAEFVHRRGAEVQAKHNEKIKDINLRLDKLHPKKKGRKKVQYTSFDAHEKRKQEEQTLQQRKQELEDQGKEFQSFQDTFSSQVFGTGIHVSKRCLEALQTTFERECSRLENALPIYGRKTKIVQQVEQNQVSVVLGETGSGKSTQIVQYLFDAGFGAKGVIVCTQPRKVAASSLCQHVAKEMQAKHLVGCRVGVQNPRKTSAKILYTTDHSLLNECLKDPTLSKYSCIIIDEAHERSIYTDLLLGMIKKALQTRPELRVVITSATIDPDLFVRYFSGCPVLRVSGRMFPVDVIYRERKEDYVHDAVGMSYEIHTTEEREGDVLVFLTSPAEVERACEKLQAKCGNGVDLQVLPLHGKLRQEDQMKVFESYPGKRKVIFATNCAETSVTVPGVKYVVDSGKVKEMRFDAKRNMSSLVVTDINKSSAEQRKGRAGRTQAGKCYRLYSQEEYQGMNDQSAPEILRIHLGQAILKLMELGVEDPADFDFVESPPKESLRSAMETLAALGAISEKRLTERGHKMARLPLEPRLARLVLQGIDQSVGSEALILAAVATVNGSIFFRMGSEEEKKLADTRKVHFCQEDGDLLTLLAAYREWSAIERRKRNKWCYENSLNAKALRIAEDTVKELTLVLKHELKVDVEDVPVEDPSSRGQTLRKILLSCYIENLCMFTDHERVGYLAVTLDQCVALHPSSALKVLNFNPRFAVYGQVLKTSREFLLNVTPVEEEWLEDIIKESGLAIDVESMKAAVLEPEAYTCSSELMDIFLSRRGLKHLKHIEEELSRSADVDSPVVLEADRDSGSLTSFARASCKPHVREQLERRLEDGREQLREETKELPILEGCATTRAVVGKGGLVQQLLMPNTHRAVVMRSVPLEIPLSHVLEEAKKHGPVQSCRTFDDQRKVIVTYTCPEAVTSLLLLKDELPYRVDVYQTGQNENMLWKCGLKVKLTWCRRAPKGTAQVSFKYHEYDIDEVIFCLHGESLFIKNRFVRYKLDKFNPARLFLWDLGSDLTENDVRSALESACLGISVDHVFLHREKEFETSPRELLDYETILENTVGRYVQMGDFEVQVLPPKTAKATVYVAFLHFRDAEYGRKALDMLERVGLAVGGRKVTITPQLRCTLRCQKNVFTLIERNVQDITRECLNHCVEECGDKALRVDMKPCGESVLLEVNSECIKHYVQVTSAIRSEMDPDVIDCSRNETLSVLLTAGGREALRKVQEKTGALIYPDERSKSIKVFGKMDSREAAKREINSVLEELFVTDSRLYEIHLRAPNRPRGLLKAVVSRHGVELVGLQILDGVQNVSLDLRRQVLRITCSKDGYDAVETSVSECAEALQPEEPSSVDLSEEVECVVCFCSIEGAVYRLACCGHTYCLDCARMNIEVAVKGKQFPVTCSSENCPESYVWKDVEKTVKDKKELRSLVEASIDHFTIANPDKVKHCITPDCGAVYVVSSDGKPFMCYGCQTEICTSCHVQYHQGVSCAMYQSEKKDSGSVEIYLKENKETKRCPKCRVLIEKTAGCNHMTCKCGAHMCWRCMEVFRTGSEVYDHQSQCRF